MNNLEKETLIQIKAKFEDIKNTYSTELIEAINATTSLKLVDTFMCETDCSNWIPIEFIVDVRKHATNEEMQYLEYRLKFLSDSGIVERTLVRVGCDLKKSWISPAYIFNTPLADLKLKIKIRKILNIIISESDQIVKIIFK